MRRSGWLAIALLVACSQSSPPAPEDAPAPSPAAAAAEPGSTLPPLLRDRSEPLPAWEFPDSADAPPPASPVPALAPPGERGNRCAERQRRRLVVERAGARLHDLAVEEALALPGAIDVPKGRHAGERGLPLSALSSGAALVRVVPCSGEPLEVSAAALGAEPERWILVGSGRDRFKLMDMSEDFPKRPLLKNLAVVQLD